METQWTVRSILEWIEGHLEHHGDEHARLSAQWLVSDVLGCSRLELYTDLERPLSQGERETLRGYVERRAKGEPLQYVTGRAPFRFMNLRVEPGVLIPRPETEVLVSEALSACPSLRLAVDLCTGSGNVACAIATECDDAFVFATDISPAACSLAQRNADELGLGERIVVVECDLGEKFPVEHLGQVDLVVSNPPYVPTAQLSRLGREVSDFEPALALDGGQDGLDVFRRIVLFAAQALCPAGVLAIELFEESLNAAAQIAHEGGFANTRVVQDLAGRERVLVATLG